LLFAAAGFAGNQVELQVGDAQRGFVFVGRAFAPQQYFHAGRHLIAGKGFGQVVIAPGPQAAHALIDIGKGADHQDRCAHANGAQGGDNRQAVQFGKHAVEGDQVVVATDCAHQTFPAIGDPIDLQAVAGQFRHDFFRRYGIVFNGQNTGHTAT